MKPLLFLAALLATTLLPGFRPSADSKTEMYMRAVSAKQGELKSNAKDGFIKVTNISFNDQALTDATTARSKASQHQVIKVTKPVDASSAQFLQAFMNRETFPTVILEYIGPNPKGLRTVLMKLDLSDAMMSDFKQNGSSETISFTYKLITVES